MTDNWINPDAFERVRDFTTHLRKRGYAEGTITHYDRSCRHFATWLEGQSIPVAEIDKDVVSRFTLHDCNCTGFIGSRNSRYMYRIDRFVRYLASVGVIAARRSTTKPANDDGLQDFADWLRRHRGIGEKRIDRHRQIVNRLLPQLGDDPALYNAALINQVMLENLQTMSRRGAQQMCGSLRMYLRFLTAQGACPATLIGAIPRIPRWRLAELPRYILSDDVERVIASCDLSTTIGLRDRAILLLLARLALRAGDVANLCLGDIDWDNALLRVSGKSRRVVALPLPQDAGDALLDYIERARPETDTDKVFIRSLAPFVPFATSSAISIIVRNALDRAGVDNPNLRGAYLLRHSAATDILRSGATLETVGALLRHRSPETTTIYAKVDTTMLSEVVQPWIGGAPCR